MRALAEAEKRECIEDTFRADHAAAQLLEAYLESRAQTPSGVKGAILEYTAAARRVDLRGCPTDFNLAYVSHIHAWEGVARKLVELDDPVNLIQSVVGILAYQTPDLTTTKELRRVMRTWHEVERVGLMHGVQAPGPPY